VKNDEFEVKASTALRLGLNYWQGALISSPE
jgi:hypothetical protein